MKSRLSVFSNSFDRASPGGVIKSPEGFVECSSFGLVSTEDGRGWFGLVGMNTRLEV